MDKKEAMYIIKEFTSKAIELERTKFMKLILDDIDLTNQGKKGLFEFGIHMTEDKEGDEVVSLKTTNGKFKKTFKAKIEPIIKFVDIEFFRSAIPLIRMFIQYEETISIPNLAKAYQSLDIRRYYYKTIEDTRQSLKKHIVDAKWVIDGINRSHWEILQIFVYSNVLHCDMKKKKIWNEWVKNPDSHQKIFQSLRLSTSVIAIQVVGLARLNENLLRELNRNKNYKNALFIVEEDDRNFKSKSIEELKQVALYAFYDIDVKIFDNKINETITINREAFQIIWKHVNSENDKLIVIYRCRRL